MNSEKLLIVAVVGLGAFMLLNSRRQQVAYAPQGGYTTPIPNVSTSVSGQAQAQAYYGLGNMIGGIYNRVFGNIGASSGASATAAPPVVSLIPDDAFAFNLPGLNDNYSFEAWLSGTP